MQNYTTLSVLNGARDISISMENASSTAFPFPSSFSWTVNDNPAVNSSLVTFGYPSVTFHTVEPSLGGPYSLSATNFFVDNQNRVLGSGVGTFTLDVLCKFSISRTVIK